MRVGFTGTREGMTNAQAARFKELLAELTPDELHQGCCIGADDEATVFFASYATNRLLEGFEPVRIVGYPSDIPSTTSKNAVTWCDELKEPKPPLERDKDIVDALTESEDVLFATPKGMAEERRSGTWFTVRYARKHGKRIVVIYPDGSTTTEGK